MRFFLLLLLTISSTPAFAQAIMTVRGCGTGCRVETKQLSEATKMPNGWAKVLIEEEYIVQGLDGVDEVIERLGGRYWFFANCHDGLAAVGRASDRSDASYFSIYTEDGKKKDFTATDNVYQRHQMLCEAIGYK